MTTTATIAELDNLASAWDAAAEQLEAAKAAEASGEQLAALALARGQAEAAYYCAAARWAQRARSNNAGHAMTRAPATTEETVDARGRLSEPEFRRIVETLLGRPRQRFKDSPHYVFGELTTAQADMVTAYLRTLAVAYDRETVTRWTP